MLATHVCTETAASELSIAPRRGKLTPGIQETSGSEQPEWDEMGRTNKQRTLRLID